MQQHVLGAGRKQLAVWAHPCVEDPRRLQGGLDPGPLLLRHAGTEVDEQPQRRAGALLPGGGIARMRHRRRLVLAGLQPLDRGVELAGELTDLALLRIERGLLACKRGARGTARRVERRGERVGAVERLDPQLERREHLRGIGERQRAGCLHIHAGRANQIAAGLGQQLCRLLALLGERRGLARKLLVALPRVDQRTLAFGDRREQRSEVIDRPLLALGELLGATAQLDHIRCRRRARP